MSASLAIDPQFYTGGACQGLPQNFVKLQSRNITPFNHPDQAMSKGRGMDTAPKPRTSAELHRTITKEHTAEAVSFALQAWGKDRDAPIARIQQIAKVDRTTAAAWWHGRNPPMPHHLFTLARRIPELKAECRRLLSMEADLDPDFQRELAALLRRFGR